MPEDDRQPKLATGREFHNKIAQEVLTKLVKTFRGTDRLICLESIVLGTVASMSREREVIEKAIDAVMEGVRLRLDAFFEAQDRVMKDAVNKAANDRDQAN